MRIIIIIILSHIPVKDSREFDRYFNTMSTIDPYSYELDSNI